MIRYLKNEDIDSKKWDACILASSPSLIYAYSWYLDLVCDDWDALILDDYTAVMPLPFTRKFGIQLAIQPPFSQQLGVFSSEAVSEKIVSDFIQHIPKKFRWVSLNLNYHNQVNLAPKKKANYVLDLMPDYEGLFENFESSLRRGIKKGKKDTCSILEGIDLASMMDLIDYQNKEKKMGISSKSREKLQRLIQIATHKGTLTSVGMYSPVNHLCAVALVLHDKQRLYYLIGASDDMGREYHGMARILNHIIKKFAGKGYTLDFEGSEIPGVANFFQKFGAKNSPYPSYSRHGFGPLNPLLLKKLGD